MNGSSPDHEKKKERFRIAFQTRQFEIDLLWKRSLFFRGFIGASFVAIASLKKEQPVLALLISGFGLVCSLSWTLVDREASIGKSTGNLRRRLQKMTSPDLMDAHPRFGLSAGFLYRKRSIPFLTLASPPVICDKNRMLISARPDPYRGQPVMAVPTVIANNRGGRPKFAAKIGSCDGC